jgi:hypothetical protein
MSYKLMVPDHVDGIGVSCGQCRRSLVGIVGSGLVLYGRLVAVLKQH